MKAPPHLMILASAGSGKTFTLTNRFLGLLAAGATPESIVALTFTRKAAGEFFDQILRKVSGAAEDESAAQELAEHIGATGLARHDFAAMLRQLVEAMPRLTLCTFDALFARIVNTFPFELGLDGEFQLLEEHAARIERRHVLQHLFAQSGPRPDRAQRDFVEAFKRATFGVEEKRLASWLDGFLDQNQEIYLAAPDASLWGNPDRIWPDGSAWLAPTTSGDVFAPLERLIARRTDLSDGQQKRWCDFFATAPQWTAGAKLPPPVSYIMERALLLWSSIRSGSAEITVDRKKVALGPEECAALGACVRHIAGTELKRHLEMTAGLFQVLDGFDAGYRTLVRQAGKMTFADVQHILAPDGGAPQLSQANPAEAAGNRLLIDWRLDGRYDHWLLDEFQDTSHAQWSVIRNLIDEVVQDESGTRSFFYVGDVKQAIYAWREGDARLFGEIFARYRAGGKDAIRSERLDKSWRSAPPLLEMVNRVFGDAEAMERLFPKDATERWRGAWAKHISARPNRSGHAVWLHADDQAGRFRRTLELLQTIHPLSRGLTVAILVQHNATANDLADYLRHEGSLPAVAESDLHVAIDNPLTTSLLALLQAAAHPADTLAWEHVLMSPWRSLLESLHLDTRDALSRHTLGLIHHHGFEGAAEWWLNRGSATLDPDDAFSRDRARQFIAAAQLYDETGDRDVADFIDFMHRHTVRDAESDAVIRVMTIHKSKGLDFDVVMLPDLEGTKLASRRGGLAVKKDAERSVDWILDLPARVYLDPDPVLSDFVADAESDACYDQLALLYVAMTRAKRGLYIVTEPTKPQSKSHNFPKLLTITLGDSTIDVPVGGQHWPGGASCGDPHWFESIAKPDSTRPAARDTAAPLPIAARTATGRRRPALSPSSYGEGKIAGSSLFAATVATARRFGEEVHRLLGAITWWDPAAGDDWAEQQKLAGFPSAAIATARACLDAPELAEVFRAPPDRKVEVWTERPFEAVIDGAWVTGRFDRVLVELDSRGTADSATVFDFKTDRLPDDANAWTQQAKRHRPQMELYRQAAARLLGVAPRKIDCALVFTAAVDAEGIRTAPLLLPIAEKL